MADPIAALGVIPGQIAPDFEGITMAQSNASDNRMRQFPGAAYDTNHDILTGELAFAMRGSSSVDAYTREAQIRAQTSLAGVSAEGVTHRVLEEQYVFVGIPQADYRYSESNNPANRDLNSGVATVVAGTTPTVNCGTEMIFDGDLLTAYMPRPEECPSDKKPTWRIRPYNPTLFDMHYDAAYVRMTDPEFMSMPIESFLTRIGPYSGSTVSVLDEETAGHYFTFLNHGFAFLEALVAAGDVTITNAQQASPEAQTAELAGKLGVFGNDLGKRKAVAEMFKRAYYKECGDANYGSMLRAVVSNLPDAVPYMKLRDNAGYFHFVGLSGNWANEQGKIIARAMSTAAPDQPLNVLLGPYRSI